MAKFGYIGNQPDASSVIIAKQFRTLTAQVGIITFNAGYVPGYIDVFLNGSKLIDAVDYTATDGNIVNIVTSTGIGDTVEMVAYKAFNLVTASSIGVSSNREEIKGDSVTDLNFVGSGFSFAVSGNTVDIYKNFVDSAGIATQVDGYLGIGVTGTNLNVTGIITANSFSGNITGTAATFTGNVTVGGTLTYDDVTNVDSIGIVTARSYVSIADSILHTGDTNTAIRFPADDTFTIETAGSERLRISSSGNVAIGISSPRCKLEVSDGTSNTAGEAVNEAYIVGATTGSSEGILTIQSNDAMASDKGGSIAFGGRAVSSSAAGANWAFINGYKENGTTANYGGYLSFATRPNSGSISERLRIDSSGRLLVGTSSALSNADLVSVNGQLAVGSQRIASLDKSVNVGNSVTFDIVGSSRVLVRVKIIVGYVGNSSYQMHAQYDYLSCNSGTSGATATQTGILQVEAGNAQFNYSDITVSRPANSTIRITYSPTSGAGTHAPAIYVDGIFSSIT